MTKPKHPPTRRRLDPVPPVPGKRNPFQDLPDVKKDVEEDQHERPAERLPDPQRDNPTAPPGQHPPRPADPGAPPPAAALDHDANLFAMALLMPAQHVVHEVKKLGQGVDLDDEHQVRKLAAKFKVGVTTMAARFLT